MAGKPHPITISHIPAPGDLTGYDRNLPASGQPSSIPPDFSQAMEVRKEVFVIEQGVPLEFELDDDDTRSWHWVAYATTEEAARPEQRDQLTGAIITAPTQTKTVRRPVGTLRLIPPPHAPHPEPWAKYVGTETDGTPIMTGTANQTWENGMGENMKQRTPSRDGAGDRATALHDGVEPYVKLGRLAVIKEFRGRAVARALVTAALDWLSENMSVIDKFASGEMFKGLVCVHAQEQVVELWASAGFHVDEQMEIWWEEGIAHVGMFCRVAEKKEAQKI